MGYSNIDRRRRSGMATVNVVVLVLGVAGGLLGIAAFVSQQLSSARGSRGRYSALLMAEAGLEAASQKIQADTSFTGETVTLTHELSGAYGSYTTTVAKVDD